MKSRFIFGLVLGLLVLSFNQTVAVDVPGTDYQIETNTFISQDAICIDRLSAEVDVGFGIEKELCQVISQTASYAETLPIGGNRFKELITSLGANWQINDDYLQETKSNIGKQSQIKRGYSKRFIGAGDTQGFSLDQGSNFSVGSISKNSIWLYSKSYITKISNPTYYIKS